MNANATLLKCNEDSDKNSNPSYHKITDCHRKIRITVDLINEKKTPEGFEFIYLPKLADPSTGIQLWLVNPVVIRLKQTQVLLAYPFHYLSAVNGRATEIVVNYENRKNYTGCDDTSSINPTCGIKHDRGRAIPYSEGFCCFCPEEPIDKKQARGGQDCSLNVQSENVDELDRYKASAHCLDYNDIWYTVSALSDPLIMHDISLNVYNKRFLVNGSVVWVSLLHDVDFEIGYKNPYQFDENKTVVAVFQTNRPKNTTMLLSANDNRLLMPQQMPGVPLQKLPPPLKNGAGDYLLISKSVIDASGVSCDTGGISYEAFAKQRDRCDVAKDSCLKNQPLEFWDVDNELRRSGKRGSFLLENYGVPHKNPIIYDKETKEHWLALEYYETQHTVLTIEFKADDIVVLTPGKHAEISKVVTSSVEEKIDFFVSVANKDLSAATFEVQVSKCGYGIPDSSVDAKEIPPQWAEDFKLSTHQGNIELTEEFTCTVAVSSKTYGEVATREVIVKPVDRCICNLHCKCMCMGESLKCVPMSVKEFQAAGFKSSPHIIHPEPTFASWMSDHPGLFILFLLLVLLLIGFVKAILGYSGHKAIAHFGLKSSIFKPRRIKHYLESHLSRVKVVYDDEGYPIDPETESRTSVLSNETIFLLNWLFFFVWPLKKISECCTKRTMNRTRNETNSAHELIEVSDDKKDYQSDTPLSSNSDINVERSEQTSESVTSTTFPPSSKTDIIETPSIFYTSNPRDSESTTREPGSSSYIPLPALSETMLEFIQSEHHGESLENKELAQWHKGAARINAWKWERRSSKDLSRSDQDIS
ncbi:hypothetical protein JTE90_023283 [Oedothorax gibbosus]|uniref:Generative cell specific-1/HAP2 domain-containing protein n=1 Tax=Oedothorax gibbosus TaxID=931172 RepID=A0AAV6UNB0_9ARAC|nr:hypothetical protein JTE90_023283 [Oedothorax gibbosus]